MVEFRGLVSHQSGLVLEWVRSVRRQTIGDFACAGLFHGALFNVMASWFLGKLKYSLTGFSFPESY